MVTPDKDNFKTHQATSPFGKVDDLSKESQGGLYLTIVGDPQLMAQLALTHTPVEHLLYQVMLAEVTAAQTRACAFSSRRLMTLTHLPNYSAVRRGLHGLINKLSIEHFKIAGGDVRAPNEAIYLVYTPEEIFARRSAAHPSLRPAARRICGCPGTI